MPAIATVLVRTFVLASAVVAALVGRPEAAPAAPVNLNPGADSYEVKYAANATVGPDGGIVGETESAFVDRSTGQARVTFSKPGRYTFVIRDRATNHDFRLRGPGLNVTSGVAPTGTKRWTLRLRAGRYVYLCSPHPLFMRGVLVVG